MSKKSKRTIVEAELKERVMRVGSKVLREPLSVGEYGTDGTGDYAIVTFGEPLTEAEQGIVTKIDISKVALEVMVWGPSAEDVVAAGNEGAPSTESSIDSSAPSSTPADKVEALVERVANLKAKPIPPINVCEKLNVRLTEEEKDECARSASHLMGELADATEAFKNESAAHKAQVKECKAQIAAHTAAHNTGLQYQEVQCEQQFDADRMRTWFVYRGQNYGERPMNAQERRSLLFGDMPDKVDPSSLPSPSTMGGDELAKRAADNGGAMIEGKAAVITKGKKGSPVRVDKVSMPESFGGVAAGVDADIAATMRSETKRGGKVDHTVI